MQKWFGLTEEQVNGVKVTCNGKKLTIENVFLKDKDGEKPVDIVLEHSEPARIGSTYGKNHYTKAKGVTPNVLEQVKYFFARSE